MLFLELIGFCYTGLLFTQLKAPFAFPLINILMYSL